MRTDYFSTGSLDYALYRPGYPVAWFDWLAGLCAVRHLAWDAACGSGQATRELAKRFDKVLATDVSAGQLQSAPPIANVEWRLAYGEESGLDDKSADLVTIAQALHWLDQERFWQECRRVLKPGGVVAVWGYGIAFLENPVANEVFQDFYHRVLGDYWPKERGMVEKGYAEVSFPFEPIEIPRFEMSQSWNVWQIAGYCASWSATECYRKETGEDPIPALRDQMARAFGQSTIVIRWPFFGKVGRVFHVEHKAADEK